MRLIEFKAIKSLNRPIRFKNNDYYFMDSQMLPKKFIFQLCIFELLDFWIIWLLDFTILHFLHFEFSGFWMIISLNFTSYIFCNSELFDFSVLVLSLLSSLLWWGYTYYLYLIILITLELMKIILPFNNSSMFSGWK